MLEYLKIVQKGDLFIMMMMVLLVSFTNCSLAAETPSSPRKENTAPPLSETTNGVKKVANIAPEDAFRRGIGYLRGHVDLLDSKGSIIVRRSGPVWLLQLRKYSDIPKDTLTITVADDGAVSLKLGSDGSRSQEWPGMERGEKDKTGKRMRPEVAFRKGIQALTKWHVSPSTLLDPSGKITFHRSLSSEEWFMDVSEYSGMRFGGYWITVLDDGDVKVTPGI